MLTERRVLIADLDDRSRSAVEECLPSDHFEIIVLHANEEPAVSGPVDLVIFRTADNLEPTRELCKTIRSRVGQDVPLVACAGRYVFPSIRPARVHWSRFKMLRITRSVCIERFEVARVPRFRRSINTRSVKRAATS